MDFRGIVKIPKKAEISNNPDLYFKPTVALNRKQLVKNNKGRIGKNGVYLHIAHCDFRAFSAKTPIFTKYILS